MGRIPILAPSLFIPHTSSFVFMPTDQLAATKPLFSCPQCRMPVQTGSVTCQACGVDLALAAVLAERRVLAFMPTSGSSPEPTPLPRFGEFLVSRG